MADVPVDCPLTSRQFEIVMLLTEGLQPRTLARELGLSPQTVYNAINKACAALGITGGSRALVAEAGARGWAGWLPPEDEAPPLALNHPHLAGYLKAFEASRWPHEPDGDHVLAMRLALAAHRQSRRI